MYKNVKIIYTLLHFFEHYETTLQKSGDYSPNFMRYLNSCRVTTSSINLTVGIVLSFRSCFTG